MISKLPLDNFFSLFNLFTSFPAAIQLQICENISRKLPEMNTTLEYCLKLIKSFPENSEELILSVIRSLMENKDIAAKIAGATKASYLERNLDVRFLVIIIHTFSKEEVIQQLPVLIKALDHKNEPSRTELVRDVFLKLVDVTLESDEEAGILTPSELLIIIHNFDETVVPVKKQIEAIEICFQNPAVFKQEVFAAVLQQLIDQARLPVLLLLSMIKTVVFFNFIR